MNEYPLDWEHSDPIPRGVSKDHRARKYRVTLTVAGSQRFVGHRDSRDKATHLYDAAIHCLGHLGIPSNATPHLTNPAIPAQIYTEEFVAKHFLEVYNMRQLFEDRFTASGVAVPTRFSRKVDFDRKARLEITAEAARQFTTFSWEVDKCLELMATVRRRLGSPHFPAVLERDCPELKTLRESLQCDADKLSRCLDAYSSKLREENRLSAEANNSTAST